MSARGILPVVVLVLLAVGGAAGATQIVVPGVPESLVEGHSVFVVIEKSRFTEREGVSAAVAVLVRERVAERSRFRGVLWFNDQYLVAPEDAGPESTRYPCGGAVLAVNAGDPDPRTLLASYNWTDVAQVALGRDDDAQDVLSHDGDYDVAGLFTDDPEVQTVPTPGSMSATGTPQPGPVAWVDASDPDGVLATPLLAPGASWGRLSTATPTALRYNYSFLITDPNDHSWVVDRYDGVTIASLSLDSGAVTTTSATFPVWAVNVLGKPVFTPDDGETSCPPFVDDPFNQAAVAAGFLEADAATCGTPERSAPPLVFPDGARVEGGCMSNRRGFPDEPSPSGRDAYLDVNDAKPPALGYRESSNETDTDGDGDDDPGYCYDSQENDEPYYDNDPPPTGSSPAGDGVADTPREPGAGCDHGLTWLPPGPGVQGAIDPVDRALHHPLRHYNALLFLYLDDLYLSGVGALLHGASDTNGCQIGTEWECPVGSGSTPDEDLEGNSHPFNPSGLFVPGMEAGFGSTTRQEGGGWNDAYAPNRACSEGYHPTSGDVYGQPVCNDGEHDYHARGRIDVYFSPLARPLEPPVRVFVTDVLVGGPGILDYAGRTDPMHENNAAASSPPGTVRHSDEPSRDVVVRPRAVDAVPARRFL